MIRHTLLVAALYGICCAIALGDTPRGEKQSSLPQRTKTAEAENNGKALTRDTGGSLIAESLSRPVDPNQLKYAEFTILAVPEPKPKEIKKHDIITIIVLEESQSSSKGTTDLKRTADFDAKVDSYVKLNAAQLAIHGVTPTVAPEIKGEGQRDFKGDAQVDRQDTFSARIGAEVIDVKPNGTLVIQAKKHIKTDEEEQDFILTGVCRAVDITPDNTILSNTLHDLNVHKVTKGAARDTTKRGWLPRLLDFASPF